MYPTLKWIADKDICNQVSWLNGFPAEGGILPTGGKGQLAKYVFLYDCFLLCSGRVISWYFKGRKRLSSFFREILKEHCVPRLKESSRRCGVVS